MANALVAHASLTIDAPRAKVWDALVTPETIKQYVPDLEYNYSRPIFRSSRVINPPQNYWRVTIKLSDDGPKTRVSVVQDNNATARELEHSEGSWRMALNNLKALLEGARE